MLATRYNEFGVEIWAKTFMSTLAYPSQATAIALMDTDLWVAGMRELPAASSACSAAL
jgi:hypothetical protein